MNTNVNSNVDTALGHDRAPGDVNAKGVLGYMLGLVLAVMLTIASFWVASTHLIYPPAVPIAIITLAVAQMGIHLVFFLHITTAPDNKNNVLALAFGILIVCLIVFGSIWIMDHLNHNMMPMSKLIKMQ